MLCKLSIVLLPVAACAGLAPAQAAPSVKTVSVSGTAANYCSVTSPITLTFSMKATGNGGALVLQTSNLTYSISCNVRSSLAMQATALFTTSSPGGSGDSKVANYTATLSPWGSGTVSATTTAPSSDGGTTFYPTTPTAVSSGGAVSATGTVSIGTPTLPTGKTQWIKNAIYSATIKLTLTVGS